MLVVKLSSPKTAKSAFGIKFGIGSMVDNVDVGGYGVHVRLSEHGKHQFLLHILLYSVFQMSC